MPNSRSRVNFLICSIACAVGILSAGCGGTVQMYPGPERPAYQTALVEIGDVAIFTFDGQPPTKGSRWRILPGEHELRLSHNHPDAYDQKIVSYLFTAVAGRRYKIGLDTEIGRGFAWRPWVKDMETEEIIGGFR